MSSSTTISFSHFTLITTLLLLLLLLPLSSATSTTGHRPFTKVFVFGDSYTDTGNTNDSTAPLIFRQISSLPYGRSFFHHPTNRYSDGRLVIDFIAESLNLPYFPPYLNPSSDTTHGVNFAVGGCTAIPFSFFVKHNSTLDTIPQSLTTQLAWFKLYVKKSGCKSKVSTPKQCKALFNNALVWIGQIGANDYTYISGTKATSKTVQKLAITYQTNLIKELLSMGAKYVVVQGLPATGCFPLAFSLGLPPTDRDEIGCVGSKNKESYEHNVVLQQKIDDLRREFPEAVIVYGDDWSVYKEVYGNPAKYGFVERFKACCGIGGGEHNFNPMSTCGAPGTSSCKHPSRYTNWDGLHTTQGLNWVVSRLFLNGGFANPPFSHLLKKAAESRE
ncbi:hypothetical protein QVD17_21020 [Tagetes erecta]|uniref:Uncharacterized protein n=1 Tax=Tagetes erecta TaxID=13708 RepID=A0AAD8KTV7_TARER|nr:hypothetical protein QVD17_21020 [Tagetes erecta]